MVCVRVLRALSFPVVLAGSLLALVFLLPWLKEGFGIEELPLFAGVAGALLLVALLYWFIHRRARGALFVLGLAVLTVPLLAYAGLSARLAINAWRGHRLERTVRIVSLRETEIRWPGIDGAVGVQLDLEVEHAIGLEGTLLSPKIWMAVDPRPTYRDYFGGLDRANMEAPVFEVTETPTLDALARPGSARVRYELFPSLVRRREGRAVCVSDHVPTPTDPTSRRGRNLGAAWFFAARGGVIVDLSAPLTDALRRSSILQGQPDTWMGIMSRLEPAALEAAGYRRCVPLRPGWSEACYCPPEKP